MTKMGGEGDRSPTEDVAVVAVEGGTMDGVSWAEVFLFFNMAEKGSSDWQEFSLSESRAGLLPAVKIGRASCRERVCAYV